MGSAVFFLASMNGIKGGVHMNKLRIVGVFIGVVLLFVMWGISLQEQEYRLTLAQSVTVVAAEGERVLGTLADDTTIWLDEACDDDWCYITWGETAAKFQASDNIGSLEKVSEREAVQDVGAQPLRVAKEAPVFQDKDEKSKQLATLKANERYVARSMDGKWAKVIMPNGEGYVPLTYTLTEAKSVLHEAIEAVKETPLYQFDSAQRRHVIGTLRAKEPVELIGTTRYYYIVSFGQGEAYVAREDAEEIGEVEVRDITLVKEVVGSFMLTTSTPVYVDVNVESDVLAILEPSMRYTTIGYWKDWAIVRIGGRIGFVEQQRNEQQKGIAVLHYEHVLPKEVASNFKSSHTIVTEEQFKQQMEYLASQGYTTITKENLANYIKGSFVVPQKAVLITFDGGLLSARKFAYPILKEHGFKAVQHVIASRVTRETGEQTFDETKEQYITVADINKTSDVFDHEAQTFNLHQLIGKKSILVQADVGVVKDDLRQLVKALGTVTSFAYPFGQYSEEVIDALDEYGFTMAFTQQPEHVVIGYNAMTLPRYSVTQNTTLEQFRKMLGE